MIGQETAEGIAGLLDSGFSLGIGFVIVIVVGRSIYTLINQWRDLAKDSQEREQESQDRLDKLRSTLDNEREQRVRLEAELHHEKEQRRTAEEVMTLQIASLQAEITGLRKQLGEASG